MFKGRKFLQGAAVFAVAVFAFSACAYTPLVGVAHPALSGGVNPADIAACDAHARAQAGDPGQAAAQGGLTGGLIGGAAGAGAGAIGGALSGHVGRGAGYGAAAGALVGILAGVFQGTQEAKQRYNSAYAACMQAKGYIVR